MRSNTCRFQQIFFSIWVSIREHSRITGCGEGGGNFFNSSLPLPPASQTLKHYPGNAYFTSAHNQQLNSNQELLVSEHKLLTTKLCTTKLSFSQQKHGVVILFISVPLRNSTIIIMGSLNKHSFLACSHSELFCEIAVPKKKQNIFWKTSAVEVRLIESYGNFLLKTFVSIRVTQFSLHYSGCFRLVNQYDLTEAESEKVKN